MNYYLLPRQHIQNHSEGHAEKQYWGYPSRVLPCQNDRGTCEYLDAVYHNHELSMLYTFILWAIIGGCLAVWVGCRSTARCVWRRSPSTQLDAQKNRRTNTYSFLQRRLRSLTDTTRRVLLPESLTSVFGRVSRVQLIALAVISAYLVVFSLVGITYKTWITPIKGSSKFNTRTGIGGWADRVGAFAYALTPLSILLCSRESILSILTGLPHTSFLFLHIWLGRIIFVQSFLHSLGWTIIQTRLYQPQPQKWRTFIKEPYIIWGVIAMLFVTVLFVGSVRRVIRCTGYEFFKITHYITAALFFGACWAHWDRLACWMIAAMSLFFLDGGLRLLRTLLIHRGQQGSTHLFGLKSSIAGLSLFEDCDGSSVLRLEFEHEHKPWKIGQHFYLTFPGIAWWQAHPFTPISLPQEGRTQKHVYVIRVKGGITRKLADLVTRSEDRHSTTSVVLCGPYGKPIDEQQSDVVGTESMLAIAGGTGISFVLPAFTSHIAQTFARESEGDQTERTSSILVWFIRHAEDIKWLVPELQILANAIVHHSSSRVISTRSTNSDHRPVVQIFVTRSQPHNKTEQISQSTSLISPLTKNNEKQLRIDEKEIIISTTTPTPDQITSEPNPSSSSSTLSTSSSSFPSKIAEINTQQPQIPDLTYINQHINLSISYLTDLPTDTSVNTTTTSPSQLKPTSNSEPHSKSHNARTHDNNIITSIIEEFMFSPPSFSSSPLSISPSIPPSQPSQPRLQPQPQPQSRTQILLLTSGPQTLTTTIKNTIAKFDSKSKSKAKQITQNENCLSEIEDIVHGDVRVVCDTRSHF